MLSIGIVGLPNVGKSTLFQAVTNKQIDIQNYPFTTIEPNVGVVAVPDERVDTLAELSRSAKKIYATIEFTDIAGLVKGASQGEGLGNKFLANIREVDAIAHVVRVHDTGDVLHVHGVIDPISDIEIINAELILADLETAKNRLENLQRKSANDKEARTQIPIIEGFIEQLQNGKIMSARGMSEDEQFLAKQLSLLTAKPFIYVLNVSESQLAADWQPDEELRGAIGNAPFVVMCNKLELELSELEGEEKTTFLKEIGLPQSGLDQLIKTAYEALGLISFLTTGEKESRAWTTEKGSTAPQAARAIHTDFERLFIRAEVITYDDLITAGSLAKAREQGKLRTEGKDYIVQDGDVIEFLIGK